MKKLLILIFGFALFSVSNSVTASPVQKTDQTTVYDVGKDAPAVPFFNVNIQEEAVVILQPVEKIVPTSVAIMKNGPVIYKDVSTDISPGALGSKIFIDRYYFNHEDNKKYPPYLDGNLCRGFLIKQFRPVA